MTWIAKTVKDELLNFREDNPAIPITRISFNLPRHFGAENEMRIMKYASLLDSANRCIANDSGATDPKKTVDNFKSACRSWMTFLGKEPSKHNVGAELNTKFEEMLKNYLAELQAAGLSEATIRDRKSAINKLHSIYKVQSSILHNERSSDVGTELRRLLLKADISVSQLAKLSKVSISFIKRMMNNSNFQKSGVSKIKKIENVLIREKIIINSGHLTELLSFIPQESNELSSESSTTAFGLNSYSVEEANHYFKNLTETPLRRLTLDEFRESFPVLYQFSIVYREHKISSGEWSVHPVQKKKSKNASLIFSHNGRASYSPSFDIYLNTLTGYIAYLLDYKKISKLSLDSVDSLINSSFLIRYVQFLKDRRDGMLGGNSNRISSFSSEFSKEVVRQVNAGFIEKPLNFSEIHLLKERVKNITKKATVARIRNPWEKLSPFFELDEPAKPLIQLSKMLIGKAKAPQTFIDDAIRLRDAFLLQFLAALPLRERTLINLTYKSDNTGHLKYSNKERAWVLDIPANIIKNQRPIRRVLPSSFNALIETYLGEARPRLLATYDSESVDWLFIAKNTARHKQQEINVDEDGSTYQVAPGQLMISARLGVITKKYLGIAIRAHAFRHLMATRFLKLNPGQYQACADLLGDKIETVKAFYAFHDDKWNEKLLNESFERAFI